MFETIRLETDARGVATLTLARPDKHNSMSATMISDLTQAADQIAEDAAVRADRDARLWLVDLPVVSVEDSQFDIGAF